MIHTSNIALLQKTFDFWDKLSSNERENLLEHTSCVSYEQSETVYDATRNCLGVLIVKSGELRTFILSEAGKEVTLYRLTKGEVCILSASCMLNQITFDVYIEAEKPSEILLVDSSYFSDLVERNIYAENYSLKVAVDKFSEVMWTMEQILFMNFDQRLAVFLLDEAAKTGSETLALTHEQIAKYVGSAREVVSRMMKYFEKEGFVSLCRGKVIILNKSGLKKLLDQF